MKIEKNDLERIYFASNTAINRLESIINGCFRETLNTDFLKEKVDSVQSCINFMKSFYEVDNG